MKQKLVLSLLIGFLTFTSFSGKALAAEGDVWLMPANQNVETSQHFDIEVHADTGGKALGAFNFYFDFTATDITIDTSIGLDGVDEGADGSRYIISSNSEDIANGHLRFAGISAQNSPSGTDIHLVTIHAVSTADFTSGVSNMTLRVNELSEELGMALATGTITGATVTYLSGDTTPAILSNGSPSGTIEARTGIANLSLSSLEAATCKYGTISGVAYDSIADTFTSTGGTTHTQGLTGLVDGTTYNYYVRCADAQGNQNTSDFRITFYVNDSPSDITLTNTSIGENEDANTTVGALSTTDSDSGDTHTYSLACDTPGADDASFNISGSDLRSSAVFDYEVKNSYAICIRTDDGNNGIYDKNYTITVTDVDDTAPTLAEVTPIATPTIDNTPDYTFSSDEAGTITYGGDCASSNTTAISGDNTITFNALSDGTHSNCTVTVTDASSNASSALSVTSFSVDATVPTIDSISSDKANGVYAEGEVIDIDVIFSEVVTSSGDVTITLETGDVDRTCAFSVAGVSNGSCNYAVQAGDTTADLTVTSVAGTIADVSDNTLTNFVPAMNLADNKALVIDTSNPTITVNEGTDVGPTEDDIINVSVSDANIDAEALLYGFSADNVCDAGDDYAGNSFTSNINFHITTTHNDYLCISASDLGGNTNYQLVGQLNVADTTAPVRSAGAPVGTLSVGTTTVALSLTTDEAATCKYGTTSGIAYDSIANTFATTGGTSQSHGLTGLSNGTNYNYYVRCEDALGNQNASDYEISFSVANEVVTCAAFTYSEWSACQSDGTQTRTILSQTPSDCTGGEPVISQSCEYDSDEDDAVDVEAISAEISSPYAKIADYFKDKIKKGDTLYSKREEFSFKGKDPVIAGGTVKLYKGSKVQDEDEVDSDGKWKLEVDEDDNKSYTYKIKYYDKDGNQIESKKYKVRIDAEDPEFTDLPGKLYKSGGDSIWWKAKDNNEVKKFKVAFDGKNYTIKPPKNDKDEEVMSTFEIPKDAFKGTHTMEVKVYDKAGNKETKYIYVIVR